MPDFNDVLFAAIKKNTGDDLEPLVEVEGDDELLESMLHFLTVMLKRMKDKGKTVETVVPFVS